MIMTTKVTANRARTAFWRPVMALASDTALAALPYSFSAASISWPVRMDLPVSALTFLA